MTLHLAALLMHVSKMVKLRGLNRFSSRFSNFLHIFQKALRLILLIWTLTIRSNQTRSYLRQWLRPIRKLKIWRQHFQFSTWCLAMTNWKNTYRTATSSVWQPNKIKVLVKWLNRTSFHSTRLSTVAWDAIKWVLLLRYSNWWPKKIRPKIKMSKMVNRLIKWILIW